MSAEPSLPPAAADTKDWTWVLERPCPECGYDASALPVPAIGDLLDHTRDRWRAALGRADARRRPDRSTWSALEYAAHVRDVHRVFDERLALMLTEDDPVFPSWDQDAAAGGYHAEEPDAVAAGLAAASDAVAARYRALRPEQHERRGLRDNGSAFTVASLGRYHLHDVVHHLHDVVQPADSWRGPGEATVAAYDESASAYAAGTVAMPASIADAMERFLAAAGPGARVLEIGSAGGRDAAAMEQLGTSVRRTDVSRGFVALLRDAGKPADVVDPLTDDLADPERPGVGYDAVWANASLLHVGRSDLPTVLARLADACSPTAPLMASLKDGEGEEWSTHGNVSGPRHFTYWREAPIRAVLEGAGWQVLSVLKQPGRRGEQWLEIHARRVGP